MKSRDSLSDALHELCKNVYFQPKTNTQLAYPCITYSFEGPRDIKADNKRYITYGRYTVTNIYKSPSNKLFDELRDKFSYNFSWDRQFISDGLYHDVYTLYW